MLAAMGVAGLGLAGGGALYLASSPESPAPAKRAEGSPAETAPVKWVEDAALAAKLKTELEHVLDTGETCESFSAWPNVSRFHTYVLFPDGSRADVQMNFRGVGSDDNVTYVEYDSGVLIRKRLDAQHGRGPKPTKDTPGNYKIRVGRDGTVTERKSDLANKRDWEQAVEADMVRVARLAMEVAKPHSPN
jgi:hypothetical protein